MTLELVFHEPWMGTAGKTEKHSFKQERKSVSSNFRIQYSSP